MIVLDSNRSRSPVFSHQVDGTICPFLSIVNDFAIRQFSRPRTHTTDGRFLAGRIRSSALSIRFDEKQSAPRVVHAELRGTTLNGVPNFVIYPRAAALRNGVRPGCQDIAAYAVHGLRASFVRVIIVALFDSNLVLGSFVLIYWAATACSAIAGTYPLCAGRDSRVMCTLVLRMAHVSKPRPTRPTGGNVKRPRSRSSQLSRYYLFKSRRA